MSRSSAWLLCRWRSQRRGDGGLVPRLNLSVSELLWVVKKSTLCVYV